MKILLLGKNGQVGWELQRTLAPLGTIVALGSNEVNLADFDNLRSKVREVKPNLIVNAAAYTAVDKAEEEQDLAMAVNGIAPGILAEESKKLKAALVHYSTDYVFDGSKTSPYTEGDKPNPINIYGKTKLAGEMAIQEVGVPHLIFRTSWVYGMRGKNFLLTMLRLAREREELSIVNDQQGTPTWSRMIAESTALVLSQGKNNKYDFLDENGGIYNLTASGSTSWHEFAKAIIELDPNRHEQICKVINGIPTQEYPTPARRPLYSVLPNDKLNRKFSITMNYWHLQLKSCLYS